MAQAVSIAAPTQGAAYVRVVQLGAHTRSIRHVDQRTERARCGLRVTRPHENLGELQVPLE